ncbi:hypothetical protein GCM10020001_071650 [Nonomuraea salmonea]
MQGAKVSLSKLRGVVIGTPGVVDPRSGDVRFSFDLPGWHEGIHEALAGDLRRKVTIENDVNLAAIAERADGAAKGLDDFVLLWASRGGWGWPSCSAGGCTAGGPAARARSATCRCQECRCPRTSAPSPGGCPRWRAACSRWSARRR